MFQVYVTHPTCTFTPTPRAEVSRDTLESAIDYALERVARVVPCCSIWVEFNGDTLAIMN